MFFGRFFVIVPALAVAGSLAQKKMVPASVGTFPTTGGLFVGLLVGTILIVRWFDILPCAGPGAHRRTSGDDGQHPLLSPAFPEPIL